MPLEGQEGDQSEEQEGEGGRVADEAAWSLGRTFPGPGPKGVGSFRRDGGGKPQMRGL